MMSGPYYPIWGYKHATMAGTQGQPSAMTEQIPSKPVSGSDSRLKLACLKSESLVTVGQLYYREYVPGSCTHRPSNHESRQYLTYVLLSSRS